MLVSLTKKLVSLSPLPCRRVFYLPRPCFPLRYDVLVASTPSHSPTTRLPFHKSQVAQTPGSPKVLFFLNFPHFISFYLLNPQSRPPKHFQLKHKPANRGLLLFPNPCIQKFGNLQDRQFRHGTAALSCSFSFCWVTCAMCSKTDYKQVRIKVAADPF